MIKNSMQWLRNAYVTKVKKLPPKDMEEYYLKNWKYGRHCTPNPERLPFFCFPCGQYHADLKKHDAMAKHKRNEKRWRTEMGYRKKWSRQK